jgi:hypothetical protein
VATRTDIRTDTRTDTRRNTVYGASGVNLLAGLWLIAAPWLLGYDELDEAVWNDVLIGGAVAVLALVRMWRPLTTATASWINLALGIWLIAAPWVLGYEDDAVVQNADNAQWNDVILGVAIALLALVSGAAARSSYDRDAGTVRDDPRRY